MTCRDIMTENPSCCVPSDTAARAAQMMKSENVGPIPIVDDHNSKRLVGVVTDRDLAIKVVAEGRDPGSVRLEEIMSRDLVTRSEGDDVNEAMHAMSDHQVRRIPIIDSDGMLVGIVAQADVARHAQDEEVGDVVEDISEPSGFGRRLRRTFTGSGPSREYAETGSNVIAAAIGLGVGAGLMYLLDPNAGRRRRAVAKDKAVNWSRSAAAEVNRRAKDIGNRAAGAMTEAREAYERGGEEVPDRKLVDRVRAELGHVVSNSHDIQVSARNGHVTLVGHARSGEIDAAVSSAAGVRGVKSVDNRLEPQQHKETVQQGGETRFI